MCQRESSTCDRGEVYSHQQSEVGGDVIEDVGHVDVIGLGLRGLYRGLALLLYECTGRAVVTPQVV